jgi:hypothetical protein
MRCEVGYQGLNAQRAPRDRLRSWLSGSGCAEGTTRLVAKWRAPRDRLRSGLTGTGCTTRKRCKVGYQELDAQEGTTRESCKVGYQGLDAQRASRDWLRSGITGTEYAEGTTTNRVERVNKVRKM